MAAARIGRLATVRSDGAPHIVPVVFAVLGALVVSPIDHKPKHTRNLQRLQNLAHHPAASLLVDHYRDDWSQLWWVRIDGTALVTEIEPSWIEVLAAKYEDYRHIPPTGQAIAVGIDTVASWEA